MWEESQTHSFNQLVGTVRIPQSLEKKLDIKRLWYDSNYFCEILYDEEIGTTGEIFSEGSVDLEMNAT